MASVGSEKSNSLSLNLTPMLDIFSILVTFLLMSYSTDAETVDTEKDTELPMSATVVSLDEVPTIKVTPHRILINDKEIVALVNGDVPIEAQDQGAIRPVYDALATISEQNKKTFAKVGQEVKEKSGTLAMMMDQEHRFKLMKRIMLSAEQADFIKFKLLVMKNDS